MGIRYGLRLVVVGERGVEFFEFVEQRSQVVKRELVLG